MTAEQRRSDEDANTPVQREPVYPAASAFTVAMATILLQLVQTRIFGVVYWNHLVYFIVSIALLGFGISGTWLTFANSPIMRRVLSLRNAAILFVVTSLLSSLVVPRLGISLGSIFSGSEQVRLFITYTSAVFPYFFGGWILGSIFRDHAERMHFLYFVDLIGAGLGCVVFVVCIRPWGAVNLVLVCGVLVAAPVLAAHYKNKLSMALAMATLALMGWVWTNGDTLSRAIVPERTKAFNANWQNLEEGEERVHEFSEWNTISRIDVVSSSKRKWDKRIYIDGDAWTAIMVDPAQEPPPWDPDEHVMMNNSLPYLLHKDYGDSLVIGSGGGIDVWQALRAGAKRIDAIEINPTTIDLGLDRYRGVNADLFHRPGVTAYLEEGRSFIRRTDKNYDVIMLHGIDTFAALNAGAYVLSENYLYTVEAFKDYILRLKPGGTLCVTRWRHQAESPRLFIVALEALHDLGVENPEQCIIGTAKVWMTVLVRRTPFSADDVQIVSQNVTKHGGHMFFPVTADTPDTPESNLYARYAALRAESRQGELLDAYQYRIGPVWDDSPFFFHYEKPRHLRAVFEEKGVVSFVRGHWPSFTLFALLGLTLVAVTLFMLIPLAGRRVGEVPRFKSWLLYFTCLGTAFIFVEIALMQRFALLLGHPARSLVLVLGGLLIFSGIGSFSKDRFKVHLPTALGVLVVFIIASAVVYPWIIVWALGASLPVRALVTLALVAPLGLLMGMPFPTGIRMVSRYSRDAVPWMWGVNGGTSVLGSILAILLAIELSFTAVLLFAALGYAIALVLFSTVFSKLQSD